MIVLIATAWSASQGGVNAFNIELGRALARTGYSVVCAVTSIDDIARAKASADQVKLVKIPGGEDGKPVPSDATKVIEAIRSSGEAGNVELWIGHDIVSGETATAGADQYGGALALIHHMDYLSYQNFNGDRGDDAARNHQRQIALFSHPKAHLFGVGSQLKDSVQLLGAREAVILVPGFPEVLNHDARDRIRELRVLAAGRFDERTEPLKRIGAAVRGFAQAVRRGADTLPSLAAPVMTVAGIDNPDTQKMLFGQAREIAGKPLNFVPTSFDPDPTAMAKLASRSHLVIVPSRHEGFSLVGWEAIGSSTSLIIGSGAGLTRLLDDTLQGQAEGLLQVLPLNGTENDERLIADAVIKVASDPKGAMRRARLLRDRLATELICTWQETAEQILVATGLAHRSETPILLGEYQGVSKTAEFICDTLDHFPRCAELGLSAAQGSSRQSTELIVELRFGVTELVFDDIKADLALRRTTIEVKPHAAKLIRADRLGEGKRAIPGIEARAGGAWIVSAPNDDLLLGRALGADSLCMIGHSSAEPMSLDVEVSAKKSDISCQIQTPKRRLSTATKKVMAVFLKEAIWKKESDYFLLSKGTLKEDIHDQ